MEIGPESARLAAERAVARIDEIRSSWNFDMDLAAEARKFQHFYVVSEAPHAR
jgi:hypothetical protein